MNTNPPRRRAAKWLYKLSGHAAKIKTRTRTYRLTYINSETGEMRTQPSGHAWVPNPFSMWLLKQSWRLDWDHWDHWALVHDKCEPIPCAVCNGCLCADIAVMDAEF